MDGWAAGRQTDRQRTTDRRITTNEDGKRGKGEKSRRGKSENGVILLAQSVSHHSPLRKGPPPLRGLRGALPTPEPDLALKRLNYAVRPPHSGHQVAWPATTATAKLPPFPSSSRFIQKGRRSADPFSH